MEAWPWRQGAHPGRSVAYLNNSDEVRGMNRASWQREVALLSGGTIDRGRDGDKQRNRWKRWKPDGRRRIDKRPNARVDRCVRRDSNYLCWSLSMQMPYLHSITARHASISARPANHGIFLAPLLFPTFSQNRPRALPFSTRVAVSIYFKRNNSTTTVVF